MRDVVPWPAAGAGWVLPTHNCFAMNTDTSAAPQLIEIRRYPNRRYYDSTRSRHLTLEQIHALIRDGSNVRVVDSQTSADITGKVLTQIILELDAPKLEMFPTAMLTELIRVNDRFVKGFFEKFLGQAFDGFMEYQGASAARYSRRRAGRLSHPWPPGQTCWVIRRRRGIRRPGASPAPAPEGDLAGSCNACNGGCIAWKGSWPPKRGARGAKQPGRGRPGGAEK